MNNYVLQIQRLKVHIMMLLEWWECQCVYKVEPHSARSHNQKL